MSPELLAAVEQLLSDIEAMQTDEPPKDYAWFGPFEQSLNDGPDGSVFIEWPNLAISYAKVNDALDRA